jgi:hypothetical protein
MQMKQTAFRIPEKLFNELKTMAARETERIGRQVGLSELVRRACEETVVRYHRERVGAAA